MVNLIKGLTFTRIVAYILLFLMGTVVVLSLADLAYIIFLDIHWYPLPFITFEEVEQILSFALWVIIALELFQSVKVYLDRHTSHRHHVETVLVVSIIAVARKVIVLNLHEYDGLLIIGLASIIVALCGGYYLLHKVIHIDE